LLTAITTVVITMVMAIGSDHFLVALSLAAYWVEHILTLHIMPLHSPILHLRHISHHIIGTAIHTVCIANALGCGGNDLDNTCRFFNISRSNKSSALSRI
jgi:hypothetical protein